MFLSDLSIKQPVLATMMMAALAVLGLTSYQALKVDLFPDVEFPVVTVTTRYTGASPETVERDVTKFIEEAVNTVEGVRHIESTSQEGLSTIVVQFNVGVPTLNASQDIRGKVAAIRGELPREIDEPIILRIDPASTPIVSAKQSAKFRLLRIAPDWSHTASHWCKWSMHCGCRTWTRQSVPQTEARQRQWCASRPAADRRQKSETFQSSSLAIERFSSATSRRSSTVSKSLRASHSSTSGRRLRSTCRS